MTEEATGAEAPHPVADTAPTATKVAAAALEASAAATVGAIEGDIAEETEEGTVVETEGASEEATVAGSAEIVVVEDLVEVEVVEGAFNVISSRSSSVPL